LRIHLEGFGFASPDRILQEQVDARTTRIFKGTGGPLLPVPGLLELHQVRVPGLILQDKIPMEFPLDPQGSRMLSLETECIRLIHGVDGAPMLERSRFSNFGIFQPGDWIVTGTWDEAVSPVPSEPVEIPESVHRPVMTSGALADGGEVHVGGRTRKG